MRKIELTAYTEDGCEELRVYTEKHYEVLKRLPPNGIYKYRANFPHDLAGAFNELLRWGDIREEKFPPGRVSEPEIVRLSCAPRGQMIFDLWRQLYPETLRMKMKQAAEDAAHTGIGVAEISAKDVADHLAGDAETKAAYHGMFGKLLAGLSKVPVTPAAAAAAAQEAERDMAAAMHRIRSGASDAGASLAKEKMRQVRNYAKPPEYRPGEDDSIERRYGADGRLEELVIRIRL